MTTCTLPMIAQRHCAVTKPALNLRGFVSEHYLIGFRYFRQVATGKKQPSDKMLRAVNAAHHRLFPDEPVMLVLPNNHPPVLLGIQPPTLN